MVIYEPRMKLKPQLDKVGKDITKLKPLVDEYIKWSLVRKKMSGRDIELMSKIKERMDERYWLYIRRKKELGVECVRDGD